MDDDFFKYLFDKQVKAVRLPANDFISEWAIRLINLLYPESRNSNFEELNAVQEQGEQLKLELVNLLRASSQTINSDQIAEDFFDGLQALYHILDTDIAATYDGDPAAISRLEIIRTYPGFYAICFYRIAHLLHQQNVPLIPRILTEHAHSRTGIDIHPGATIGEYFHIDHGTGVVIGETTKIGRHVKIYQGVTLGALSVNKDLAGKKRHPTVEDGVVIYAGATILGGETIIGHDSIVGGNVWLTESILPYATVYHSPVITIRNINELN
ncbi:serine O-acetyltransferase [Pedobacter insulae]|uniref:Serine O-acetyltransferase n=1 Tax=Pedobacter insulae TaxID=414048 RepID=A0A1I2YC84_9SPHI|nr:serine acetyltransferase [Pedobacter insulae]SFH23300.1 serine O-acetyltransferase [Pedobacter insulae]